MNVASLVQFLTKATLTIDKTKILNPGKIFVNLKRTETFNTKDEVKVHTKNNICSVKNKNKVINSNISKNLLIKLYMESQLLLI